MADSPISFSEANVRQLRAGAKIETRRPAGRLGSCVAGDRLWIREPFHFGRRFDTVAPLQVVQRGGRVTAFAADWPWPTPADGGAPDIGRRRFAREMPKVFHRYHLVVRHVRREPLHDIDEIGARAEGCTSRATYMLLWDGIHAGGVSMKGAPVRWRDNPLVDVISFTFVDRPLTGPVA